MWWSPKITVSDAADAVICVVESQDHCERRGGSDGDKKLIDTVTWKWV